MINTVQIKRAQLEKGFFTIGSGAKVILVMGSCRVVNYVTYLDEWNKANGNVFTIHTLDPFNFCWNANDDRVDYDEVLLQWEKDERMLSMLRSVNIFIHEYYQNSGFFNVAKNGQKNIYQYGMNPEMDICICNLNDYFILFGDIVTFDSEMRKIAIQDFNVLGKLSTQTEKEIYNVSQRNISKFYEVCRKSDVPEMEEYFKNNFTKQRLFWNYNHTSKWFTLEVFKLINAKYLHLDLSNGFDESHEDIFANNYTRLTDYDIKNYGYEWNNSGIPEEVVSLKNKLF